MTLTQYSPKRRVGGTFFSLSTSFIAAQTDHLLVDEPGSGKALYLTDVVFATNTVAGTLSLTQAPTGTSINVIPPLYVAANTVKEIHLNTPLKTTDNSSLRITTVVATNPSVIICGYII